MIGKLAVAGAAGVAGAALWWRKNPSACPYSQRFWVEAPHPFITRERLHEILEPRPGERILEVGPGTGYYALPVAGAIAPDGRLDVLDVQQEMLDHTLRRAGEQDIANITPTRADARELPYPDASFDAAYLVTVLGEIPDQVAALRELRRVVKPGAGSWSASCSATRTWSARQRCRTAPSAAGLVVERKLGGRLWHFTRLQPA